GLMRNGLNSASKSIAGDVPSLEKNSSLPWENVAPRHFKNLVKGCFVNKKTRVSQGKNLPEKRSPSFFLPNLVFSFSVIVGTYF
ncbi:MAG: hypothetical protein IKL39_05460, partial [Mailhella sp.]|nr:hypothetical protein [Mailhella sp.]